MTTADKVTFVRLVLTPVFFVVYFYFDNAWTVPALWALFALAELSDLLDGQIARRMNQSSNFGKLLDPFADTLARITYFLLFTLDGYLPAAGLVIILWREFSILFVRNLMLQKGVSMGARWGGKIKAVCYMLTGLFALVAASIQRLNIETPFYETARWITLGLFFLSIVLAVISFLDYIKVYRNSPNVNK